MKSFYCRCLQWVGAKAVDTRDELGRERFLVFPIKSHLTAKYPNWYQAFDTDNAIGVRGLCWTKDTDFISLN